MIPEANKPVVKQESDQQAQSERADDAKIERENALLMRKDSMYATALKSQILAQTNLIIEKKRDLQTYLSYNQATLHKKYPKSLLAKKARPSVFTRDQLVKAGEQVVKLVPVRIDVEHDGVKIRDDFTWNVNGKSDSLLGLSLHPPTHIYNLKSLPSNSSNEPLISFLESVITHEAFAKLLCMDVGVKNPSKTLINQIVASIKEQVDDYFTNSPAALDAREDLTCGNDGLDDGTRDLPELRTVIKLDITIDQQRIVDQFEWDISCTRNNPEFFAETLVNDLRLAPEFKTAIAHSIREQIHTVAKSLLILNHDFSKDKLPNDDQLSGAFLPAVQGGNAIRYGKFYDDFGPNISKASAVEMEKIEKEVERESRRKRRSTARSRRGVALPEETSKTTRTPLPIAVKFEPKNPFEEIPKCSHCKNNPRAANEKLCISCAAFEAKHGYKPGDDEFMDEEESDGEYRPGRD